MAKLSEEDKQILNDLQNQISDGDSYVRAKQIAQRIGLTSKQVGVRLAKLADKSEEVKIEKWSRAKSTTWRVSQP